MSVTELAHGLLNETRYTTKVKRKKWEAHACYPYGDKMYWVGQMSDYKLDLLTDNEHEAAHYMLQISEKWTVQS